MINILKILKNKLLFWFISPGFSVYFVFYIVLLLVNSNMVYAKDNKNPVDILNARIKQRAVSDKIPVYSYGQCTIGNCSPYTVPALEKIPEELPKPIETKPVNVPVEKEKKDFNLAELQKAKNKFDYNNLETSISVLKINDKLAYDFEVIVWPNGSISVPVKTLAELVDIDISVNHVNNNISFIKPNTEEQVIIDPKKSQVLVGSNLIEVKNPKILEIKEGFVIYDDVYIPEQLAQYLLDVQTSFSEEKYTFNLETNRVLKAIVKLEEQVKIDPSVYEEPITTVNELAKESKLFKVKQFNYNIGSSMSQTNSSDGKSDSTQNMMANFSTTGNLLGGKYNLGTSSYYNKNGLELGGYRASLDYTTPEHELSMGSTNAKISDLVIPGTNILGARFGTLGAANNSSIVPRIIAGRAEDNTQVELFINGVYTDKQAVQNGRFEFDSLNYPSGSFVKIKVEQVNQDNTRKVVYDRDFSQDKDLLAPGQKEYLVFSGIDNSITRHKFTLLGKGSQNYYQEPMRFSTGAKYKMGITPKLTAGVNLAHSRNLGNSSTPFFISGGSTPRIIRQSRSTSGTVASTDFNYNPTENLKLSSETAVSSATSASQYEPNSVDIGSFVSFDYTKPDYHLYGKAFSYGPNFYSAGFSDTTDKRGGELSGNWSVGPLNLSGSAIKYNSNLDNMFYGGLSNISNYNVYLSGPIDDNASIRAGIRSNTAENSIYNDSQTNFDLTLNRKLYKNADLSVNYVHTISSSDNYETRTRSAMSNDRINASLNIDANKVGVFRLSHDITMLTPEEKLIISGMNNYNYEPPVYKNLYLRLDRSRQPIKGFTFSPSTGYRYGGDNKGILLGANLGYILKSGRQIMLNYNYNSTFARYLNSGMSIGGNNAHALSVNFIDTLNFGLGNTAQANNQFIYNQDSGIIKGCVYLDLNQNGAKDEGEEGVPDIEITIKSMYTVATDKKGNYVAPNLSDRVYVIGIEKNTLPVIYAPTGNDVAVNVKRSKVYVANLGLIVTPGSISGKVEVNKENANNSEVIILLLDKDNKEIKYTTTDSTGGYYIGSIPPGEYRVVVDKNYLDYNGLQEQEGEHKVSVPLVTDDFVDIEGIDFKLIEKTAEVKTF